MSAIVACLFSYLLLDNKRIEEEKREKSDFVNDKQLGKCDALNAISIENIIHEKKDPEGKTSAEKDDPAGELINKEEGSAVVESTASVGDEDVLGGRGFIDESMLEKAVDKKLDAFRKNLYSLLRANARRLDFSEKVRTRICQNHLYTNRCGLCDG